MSKFWMSQPLASEANRRGFTVRLVARGLALGALLVALAPLPAHAQFGALRKLKNKMSAPDSATRAKDSLEQIAKGVSPDSVKIGKGLLARGVSAAKTANDKLEATTGISAKDAALAATGVGATSLMAKKLGVDPVSLGSQMMSNRRLGASQKVAGGNVELSRMGVIPGMPDAATMRAMQAAQAQAMAGAGRKAGKVGGSAAYLGVPGMTEADVQAYVAFQQEMMQVAMAASTGDATAQARLNAWQTLALKHEAEIQRLSLAAQGGDMAAIQKLQTMQFTLMKEWANSGSTKAKVSRAVKP
jgi:hypothetical protein